MTRMKTKNKTLLRMARYHNGKQKLIYSIPLYYIYFFLCFLCAIVSFCYCYCHVLWRWSLRRACFVCFPGSAYFYCSFPRCSRSVLSSVLAFPPRRPPLCRALGRFVRAWIRGRKEREKIKAWGRKSKQNIWSEGSKKHTRTGEHADTFSENTMLRIGQM